jgi:hypothetical protein
MSGINHSQMPGHHNSTTGPVEVPQYGGFSNMMQPSTLDMNGLNQNNLVAAAHMNNLGNVSSGFTPGGMTMAPMNQGSNMSGASPMHMFLQQQHLLTNNGQMTGIDENDLIGQNQQQQQYMRMQQMQANHPTHQQSSNMNQYNSSG